MANKHSRHDKLLLWLDDHRGIYIPRDFANSFKDDFRKAHIEGVTDEDWLILAYGPGGQLDDDTSEVADAYKKAFPDDKDEYARGERYWDTWSDVTQNAKLYLDRYTDPTSTYYWTIQQDGAVFLVRDDVEWCHDCDGWKLDDTGCTHTIEDNDDA